jgi:hypothetical protein
VFSKKKKKNGVSLGRLNIIQEEKKIDNEPSIAVP